MEARWRGAIAGAMAVACAGGALGALAFFTDTDKAVNDLDIAEDLKIEVVEPEWDAHPDEDGNGIPDVAENLVPKQTIAKDPAVHNKSDYDAYIYAEVSVPMHSMVVDKASNKAVYHELFSYEVLPGWTLVDERLEDGQMVRTYAWDSILAGGATTGNIFDEVTVANMVSSQGFAGHSSITVTGKAIQAEGFANSAEALSAYTAQRNEGKSEVAQGETYAGLYGSVLVLGSGSEAPATWGGAPLTASFDADITQGFKGQSGMPWADHRNEITTVVINEGFAPDSMAYLFARLNNCTSIWGLDKIDTSHCTSMSNLFFATSQLRAVDLSSWDMSSVTRTDYMFSQALRMTSIGDTSSWDMSSVTDMSEMFDNTKWLKEVPGIETWDTSHVTDMEGMFTSARGFETLPIENWNTSSVKNMSLMFYDAQNLKLDCSGWDTSSVTSKALFNTDAPGVIPPTW